MSEINVFDMMKMAFSGCIESDRMDALIDQIGEIEVDTCFTRDTGKYETAIMRDNEIIIVEEYDDSSKVEAGHAYWVKTITENPTMELTDIHQYIFLRNEEINSENFEDLSWD